MLTISLLVTTSFAFMEFIAWSNHKWVMHGFLWSLHKDHHLTDIDGKPALQKNDWFFLIDVLYHQRLPFFSNPANV